MENRKQSFKTRAFVAFLMATSGLGLPVTGLANHLYGDAPPSVARHAWMSAHNGLGLLFVVFSIWHVVLNRRALLGHLKSTFVRSLAPSRETMFAAAVLALTLLLFVGHAFHAGH